MTTPTNEAFEIALLADQPRHLMTVAGWQFGEWGFLEPGDSVGKRAEKLRHHLHRSSLPMTLVATLGGRLIGSADLVDTEVAEYGQLSPWLSCVYVDPEFRSRGVGSRLTARAESLARRLGHHRLYLCTWNRESFYARLGWQAVDELTSYGVKALIMCKELS